MGPIYNETGNKELSEKVERAYDRLKSCDLCGNACGVNRLEGETGKCGASLKLRVSSANAHFGEEGPLVGTGGSGTIFLSYCPMACVYCQNWRISQEGIGVNKSEKEFAELMISLQERGCHNINWVTPTHYIPQLLRSLEVARNRGLKIPIVYNTGGYDSPDILKMLEGIVDIYMPDIKYGSDEKGRIYSGVKNYWTVARKNLEEMYRQVGDLHVDESGLAERGLLVRHLLLPGDVSGTEKVLDFIVESISKETYINIMSQYRPCYKADGYEELNRSVSSEEVEKTRKKARKLGLKRGF